MEKESPNPYSPWIKMNPGQWNLLTQYRQPVLVKKNTLLFRQQDLLEHVFLVKTGRIRITVLNVKGAERHILIAEEGCMIGEEACLSHRPSTVAATAIVDSALYRIPADEFLNIVYANRPLLEGVVGLICRKNQILTEQLKDLSFSRSGSRVAAALVNLVHQYGSPVGEGHRINLKFTHQDLAHLINTSRVTVSNTCSELIQQGVIEKTGGFMVVRDLGRLEEIASSGDY